MIVKIKSADEYNRRSKWHRPSSSSMARRKGVNSPLTDMSSSLPYPRNYYIQTLSDETQLHNHHSRPESLRSRSRHHKPAKAESKASSGRSTSNKLVFSRDRISQSNRTRTDTWHPHKTRLRHSRDRRAILLASSSSSCFCTCRRKCRKRQADIHFPESTSFRC